MTDERRLQDKLSKLATEAAEFGAKGRLLQRVTRSGFLGAVLQEIDETILARMLTFENDRGASVGFEVSNRRLLRLSHLSDSSALQAHSSLLDQSISDADGKQAAALATMLDAFLADTDSLHVVASKLHRDIDAAEIGCSVTYLATTWRVGLYGEDPVGEVSALEPFIGYCQDISEAWIMVEGDAAPEKNGHSKILAALGDLLNADLAFDTGRLGFVLQDDSQPHCVILAADPANNRCVVYLQSGAARLFCLIPTAEMAALISAWHQND